MMQDVQSEEVFSERGPLPLSDGPLREVQGRKPNGASCVEPFPETWRRPIVAWAKSTRGVDELWLFGSRAKGTSRPGSDVDIAVALVPARGADDWALSDFLAFFSAWRSTLGRIVRVPVSLTAIVPGTPADREVRSTGQIIWKRSSRYS
jgi:predicted nucleotidyltransferase